MPRENLLHAAAGIAAAGVLALALMVTDTYVAKLIGWIAINALLAASLRFVLLIGELNFATGAFFGLGAYVSGVATAMYDLPLPVALLLGGGIAAACSVAFGYVTLRVKGPYFLLIGFAFTEVLRMIYAQTNAIGGNSGLIGIFPPMALERWFTGIVVAVVLALFLMLYLVERSDFGKLMRGIRNNDAVVQTVGVDVHMAKVACLAIASFAAGMGGALHAHANNVISPGDFGFLLSTFALAYLKVGGESHILGAVVGAVLLTALGQFALGLGAQEHIFYGGAIVAAVLLLPHGVIGLLQSGVQTLFQPRRMRRAAPVVARGDQML